MKKIILVLLVFSIMVILSCSKTTESNDEPPTVEITYPANNSEFAQGEIITITVNVTEDKGIKEVKFYIDDVTVGTDDTAPYEHEWDTSSPKDTTHIIYAKAWDTNDNVGTSSSINVTLTNTVTDHDGNVYHIVKIGDQEWLMENLKVIHYRNGDSIPNLIDDDDWTSDSSGAYCAYSNNNSNVDTYGCLYNWHAVHDSRGLAPEGWHIPTEEEWQTLRDSLGGWNVAGGKMKSTGTIEGGDGLWHTPNTDATNESGFTALPSGYRSNSFGNIGEAAYFWSFSDFSISNAVYCYLFNNSSTFGIDNSFKTNGYSVRCVRD